jgi:hypothetical protein
MRTPGCAPPVWEAHAEQNMIRSIDFVEKSVDEWPVVATIVTHHRELPAGELRVCSGLASSERGP